MNVNMASGASRQSRRLQGNDPSFQGSLPTSRRTRSLSSILSVFANIKEIQDLHIVLMVVFVVPDVSVRGQCRKWNLVQTQVWRGVEIETMRSGRFVRVKAELW